MADGAVTYTVTVDAATAERLDAAARDAGIEPEAFVLDLIEDAAGRSSVSEAARRFQHEQATLALAHYDRTGIAYPLEDVLKEFRADVEAGLGRKGSL
ncbi:hypothetical protein ACETK8_09095 [Brevundimonas staleyi]|uniref:Ribbon-helix-helix protein, CopG family n=1 Tax=Brevundimonas staleyi TaxID=74326 RepID=A0ABW0FV48_9CAUL